VRTKVLSEEQLAAVRRHPVVYRVLRRTRFAIGHYLSPVNFAHGPGRVHRNDFMLGGTDDAAMREYAAVGNGTVDAVERAVLACGVSDLAAKRWLEVGCGYGRVVRFLTDRVPPSSVWVTDVIGEAVEFCQREFGVNPIADLGTCAELDGTFDVIYLISVFTHLPAAISMSLLARLAELLAPQGVLVLTAHGPDLAQRPGEYGPEFLAQREAIIEELARVGASYRPYSHSKDGSYGVAWNSEENLRQMVADASGGRLAVAHYEPRGLSGHQDVYAVRRVST
jgi:SAM-dependent methyltransferase